MEASVTSASVRSKASKTRTGLLSRNKRLRWLVLLALLSAAVLVRMHHIDSTAGEFYPERQYYSAWGARCMYYSSLNSIHDWRENVLEAYPRLVDYADNSGMMVPLPTIEGIAYLLYRVAGGEYMWLPRAFSALAWVMGGFFLYLLAKRLMTREAALLATGFYLFLPLAITGSRSFQVEPLMVAGMIISIYATFRYHEKPTLRRAMTAAIVAAVAILTRPLCAFVVFGAFIGLSLSRQGFRNTIISAQSWLYGVIAVLPMGALILYDKLFPSSGAMAYFEGSTIVPRLLLDWDYYSQWAFYFFSVIGSWGNLFGVQLLVGPLTLGAAVVGAIMLRRRHARALIVGLWCGFLAFGIVFTYLVSNHHYHQLQVIPIIALCLGPVAARILRLGSDLVSDLVGSRRVSRVAVGGVLLVFVMFVVGGVAGNTVRIAETGRQLDVEAQTIGELTEHSPSAIVLSRWRGYDITYEGWFFGHWLLWETQLVDAESAAVKASFDRMCRDWQPTHLVITYLEELETRPALKEFLFATYPTIAHTSTYLVFDLAQSVSPEVDSP